MTDSNAMAVIAAIALLSPDCVFKCDIPVPINLRIVLNCSRGVELCQCSFKQKGFL